MSTIFGITGKRAFFNLGSVLSGIISSSGTAPLFLLIQNTRVFHTSPAVSKPIGSFIQKIQQHRALKQHERHNEVLEEINRITAGRDKDNNLISYVYQQSNNDSIFYNQFDKSRAVGAIAAVCPSNTEQVQQIVQLCNSNSIKILPQGAVTGLVKGSVPNDPNGETIILSTKRMQAVYAMNPDEGSLCVQAGTAFYKLREAVDNMNAGAASKYELSDWTSADTASAGGMAATNPSGMRITHPEKFGDSIEKMILISPKGEKLVIKRNQTIFPDTNTMDFVVGNPFVGIFTDLKIKLPPQVNQESFLALQLHNPADIEKIIKLLSPQDKSIEVDICEHFSPDTIKKISTVESKVSASAISGAEKDCFIIRVVSQHSGDKKDILEILSEVLEKNTDTANQLIHGDIIPGAENLIEIRKGMGLFVRNYLTKNNYSIIKLDVADRTTEGVMNIPNDIKDIMARDYPDLDVEVLSFGHAGKKCSHIIVGIKDKKSLKPATLETTEEVHKYIARHVIIDKGRSISAEHGISRHVMSMPDIAKKTLYRTNTARAIFGSILEYNKNNSDISGVYLEKKSDALLEAELQLYDGTIITVKNDILLDYDTSTIYPSVNLINMIMHPFAGELKSITFKTISEDKREIVLETLTEQDKNTLKLHGIEIAERQSRTLAAEQSQELENLRTIAEATHTRVVYEASHIPGLEQLANDYKETSFVEILKDKILSIGGK